MDCGLEEKEESKLDHDHDHNLKPGLSLLEVSRFYLRIKHSYSHGITQTYEWMNELFYLTLIHSIQFGATT